RLLGASNASCSVVVTTDSCVAATRLLTLQHQYLDDNPTGTSSDLYTVGLTVTDDDLGTSSASSFVTVTNETPTLISSLGDSILENGVATVTANIDDDGTLDVFSV